MGQIINEEWAIQRNRQHCQHKTIKTNTICVGHHYAQTSTKKT